MGYQFERRGEHSYPLEGVVGVATKLKTVELATMVRCLDLGWVRPLTVKVRPCICFNHDYQILIHSVITNVCFIHIWLSKRADKYILKVQFYILFCYILFLYLVLYTSSFFPQPVDICKKTHNVIKPRCVCMWCGHRVRFHLLKTRPVLILDVSIYVTIG